MKELLSILIDIASAPALLVALIAVLGLILQKKSISTITLGGIKTFVGFLVLTGGAGIVLNALTPLGEMFQHAFAVQGVVPNNEAIVALALTKYGTPTALIMLVGMIANILIARFTRFKYIYLTGHATLYMSCMIAVIMTVCGFTTVPLILLGGLMLGMANALSPAILQPFMKKITGTNEIALGHTGGLGYLISALVGKAVGHNGKSTEDLKIPKGLSFLRDSTVAITITMAMIYVILALFTGQSFIESKLSTGTNYIIYAFQMAGTFAAGVYVILSGVRLILGEIIPAFKGISEKLVPNSKPALDCPIVFPYAPNAVIIGFFSSFVGGIVSMFIMIALHTVIILPGVVPHFFCGATAGVFGNATGGRKGAILGSFVHGILISFMPLALMPVLGNLGFANSSFSDTDYGAVGIFLGSLGSMGGVALITTGILAVLALMFVLSFFKRKSTD
ncbi:PTS ascorbate transporter subunit IIC [Sporolactobacillus terrae]|uniref:Ascorbate-specific PTS system EIIC component n=1 Tax=Sporolactobacillus terrae TaxID=269673 RepID=A0ABX5Q4Y4_9BACL|nr:PTS ascorbate transporter subunit IIC [Sporolactobacillus terrae]QAA21694.1 PTS ascorbate transporter subunit IIC [Sporolactobacillus terrae]QAA24666.1 PTS ascorbate transporter subunit IIC [Sporolactobacillus terrae]